MKHDDTIEEKVPPEGAEMGEQASEEQDQEKLYPVRLKDLEEPIQEDCSSDAIPYRTTDMEGKKKVLVPELISMTKVLFDNYRLPLYSYIYEIETVRMSIIQPRLENISTFECSRKELEDWGESIRPIAKMAYEGKGEQKPGDWCRFCRAKPVCRACADEALALCREEFLDLDAGAFTDDTPETDMTAPYNPDTDTAVFKQPGLIPMDELAGILPTLNRISSWIESVFAFVSAEAINHGVLIPGYKVVEGRSKRVFTDTKAVVDTAVANGYTDLYKRQLITLTEFEKMMGKKRFAELLGEYVAKPPGKLALVPEDDPRPPVDLNNNPDQEFAVLTDGK